jgi:hypothetical protein
MCISKDGRIFVPPGNLMQRHIPTISLIIKKEKKEEEGEKKPRRNITCSFY